jgi:hypothetical protein
MTTSGAKAAIALSLVAGLLLTGACMVFICPVVAASDAPKSCHSMPGADPEPMECPFAVMRPVYAAPLLDHDFGQDVRRAEAGPAAVAASHAEPFALFHGALAPPDRVSPPGSELHVRLCVFRI